MGGRGRMWLVALVLAGALLAPGAALAADRHAASARPVRGANGHPRANATPARSGHDASTAGVKTIARAITAVQLARLHPKNAPRLIDRALALDALAGRQLPSGDARQAALASARTALTTAKRALTAGKAEPAAAAEKEAEDVLGEAADQGGQGQHETQD